MYCRLVCVLGFFSLSLKLANPTQVLCMSHVLIVCTVSFLLFIKTVF